MHKMTSMLSGLLVGPRAAGAQRGNDLPVTIHESRKGINMRHVIALFVTMMILAAGATPAMAVDYGSRGLAGPQAGDRVDCNPGEFVIGFHARVGVWVDQLGVVCTTWDIGTNSVAMPRDAGTLGSGGGGDAVTTTSCSADHVLSGFKFVRTHYVRPDDPQYVQNVVMFCVRPTSSPETQFVNLKDSQPLDPQAPLGDPSLNTQSMVDIVYCPPGMVATGVFDMDPGGFGYYGGNPARLGLACNKGSDVLAAQMRSRLNSDKKKYAAMHAAASSAAPPISAHSSLSALGSHSVSGGSGGSSASGGGSTVPSTPSAGPGSSSAGGIPAGPSPPAPIDAVAQDFAGNWQVHVNDGSVFPMTLVAFGNKIGGNYDPANRVGTIIDGKIKHNTLKFKWITIGSIKAGGEGEFHMDDFNDLSGTWSMGFFTGTWMATRQ